MTCHTEQIKLGQQALHRFHAAAREAGGVEKLIAKLLLLIDGEEVKLTKIEAAALSQSVGVCIHLAVAAALYTRTASQSGNQGACAEHHAMLSGGVAECSSASTSSASTFGAGRGHNLEVN